MSEGTEFNVGDIVKLVSGGPDMAVKRYSSVGAGSFYCQWFAGKKLENGDFPAKSLVLVRAVDSE
ncbi:YodC family protein [Burkholderia cepacia]|uniref:YodC family protein n=1 Tax=Burkholderia cepacia TaxID=292 RepID=UPI0009BF798B|nr:DUF2158 domain-containing protein [Burkholderia cepacia]RQT87050.1 DUF2158 domain-containing protein [Burkholderia cepacia]RQU06703.1 DUF2158 domain-containing protein [Burkholderia cepacia]RQZ83177.1 DUF2158 domain-containing protein [Burkholderia cepacia]